MTIDSKRPFGLPPRGIMQELRDVSVEHEHRISEIEDAVKCIPTLAVKLEAVEDKVGTMFDMMVQDRQDRRAALQEGAKTERVRLNSRARIVVALFGVLGVVAGAAATVLAGCA